MFTFVTFILIPYIVEIGRHQYTSCCRILSSLKLYDSIVVDHFSELFWLIFYKFPLKFRSEFS